MYCPSQGAFFENCICSSSKSPYHDSRRVQIGKQKMSWTWTLRNCPIEHWGLQNGILPLYRWTTCGPKWDWSIFRSDLLKAKTHFRLWDEIFIQLNSEEWERFSIERTTRVWNKHRVCNMFMWSEFLVLKKGSVSWWEVFTSSMSSCNIKARYYRMIQRLSNIGEPWTGFTQTFSFKSCSYLKEHEAVRRLQGVGRPSKRRKSFREWKLCFEVKDSKAKKRTLEHSSWDRKGL